MAHTSWEYPSALSLLKAAMEHALLAYLLAGAAVLLVLLLYPSADGRRKTSFNVSAS